MTFRKAFFTVAHRPMSRGRVVVLDWEGYTPSPTEVAAVPGTPERAYGSYQRAMFELSVRKMVSRRFALGAVKGSPPVTWAICATVCGSGGTGTVLA